MRIALILLLLVPLAMAGALFGLFVVWGEDLPTPRTPGEVEPSINTVLIDKNGRVIDEFFVENRNPIRLRETPDIVRQAFLATEDRRFYRHWGIDLWAVFRAFRSNLASGQIAQGGSTITQQLARNLFLSNSQTFTRKIKEAILAVRLERSFSKDEILELYLNQIYLGEGAYGIQAAADRYFGKDVQELVAPEAAMVAGLAANPSAFSPLRHPEAARERRNVVLRRMHQQGYLDDAALSAAMQSDVTLGSARSTRSAAPYFTEHVRRELIARYGATELYRGGLKVYTTLDLDLQNAAESAMEEHIRELEEKNAYRYLRHEGQRAGSLAEKGGKIPYLQGALVALEPQSGAIRALVGGREFGESSFNRATQAHRQPGSAFKPFVYASALQRGHKTNDLVLDAPITEGWIGAGGKRQTWSPQNFDRKFHGSVTLRYALMKSINTPSIRLLKEAGPKRVAEIAQSMGIESPLPIELSLALGTGETTPLELTSAYGSFANSGIWREPFSIERVEDRHGRTVERHQANSREGLDEISCYETLSLMRSVFDGGTAWKARAEYEFDAPAAGKTGTTDDYSDAWFVGFVPRLSCGVWIGFDEKKPIGAKMTGASAALPPWCVFMRKAVEIYGKEEFTPPPGMVEVVTCVYSGRLARGACPRSAKDAFRVGKQPLDYCGIHLGPAGGTGTEAPLEEAPED